CPKLTYQQRIYGYIGCSIFGWVLSIIGCLVLFGGTSAANIRLFIVLYVIGNVIAICSSGFLAGPQAQCRKMWAKTRRFSTAFYLIMLVVVLVVAILKQSIFLVLFLLAIEILAGAWYSISFIPFGRKV
ncbi:vesicle transport protein, partial [Ochromonadaceae sp. CCMP2298]